MEFRNLQTFLKISELKNFSKAALELQYAQSTVTMQIKQLETELGFPLFDRIGKQVSLTEKGLQFQAYAQEIYHLSEKAKSLLSEDIKPSGKLRIGAIESVCSNNFETILQKYFTLYPDVSLSLVTECTDTLLDLLKQNKVDIIYTVTPQTLNPEYEYPFQTEEPILFMASPEYNLPPKLTLQQLAEYPLILTEENCSYRKIFSDMLSSYGINLQPSMELNRIHMILELIKKNMGISLLPSCSAQKELNKNTLKVLDVEDFHLTMYRQLIYRKDKWLNLQMKKFIEIVSEIG